MTTRFPFFSGTVLLMAVAMVAHPPGARAEAPLAEALVAETTNFQLVCIERGRCAAATIPAADRAAAQMGLAELEKARDWLGGMGFPIDRENLDAGADGKKALRLQVNGAAIGKDCGPMASACHRMDPLYRGSLYLPAENISQIGNGKTLVHEYVHALQPAQNPERAIWINEAVATAIAGAWLRKRTGQSEVYEPQYSMVLDREFYDGEDDPGYGKWDYLIQLGYEIGSPDGIGWLAQQPVIDVAANRALRQGNGMGLFYDAGVTGGRTFDKFFPEYVARFNNVETDIEQPGRTGKYLYYGDISKHGVTVPFTDSSFTTQFDGTAAAFSAHPMLLSLNVTASPDRLATDNILLAQIDVTGAKAQDDLRLIREHRLAPEQLRDALLIDGNAPPKELGFFRVAYTPKPEVEAPTDFKLRVATHPVSFEPPTCFQAGKPAEFTLDGIDDMHPDNWRLRVDNGQAKGAIVTPARAGKIKIEVEIDSPITRRETGIDPVAPQRSRVELGTFDVSGSDCMVRLIAGKAVATYVAQGDFTEFAAPSGEAVYFSASDLALWERGNWRAVPAMAKGMILGKMKKNNVALRLEFPGAHEEEGDFISRMPLILTQRFAWSHLRNVLAPDGGKPQRQAAPCPDGSNGCRSTVIAMDGNPLPVVFDSQGRPVMITFQGEQVRFEYGNWPVRRPPRW